MVENCLAKEFESFIKIDLEAKPQFHAAFAGELSPSLQCLVRLNFTRGGSSPGKTLLFLDEIQACPGPRAITALRYFYEQMPELHVVRAAGSLLEFAFGEISVPVGRLEYLYVALR